MLGFEVWKNEKKLALAGVRESGVVSLILSWVGKGPGASSLAAAAKGPIPNLDFRVAAIDSSDPAGDNSVCWVEEPDLRLGDEIRICLSASGAPDVPVRTEPSKPTSLTQNGSRLTQCSFCGQMRKIEPAPVFYPGVGGANVFICTRCLVLAERLLDDGLASLFHLSRATDQTCSFCAIERRHESATARDTRMCRACVDMIMKDAE